MLRRYKKRWIVERRIAWFGNFRRLVVRNDRSLNIYQEFTQIACFSIVPRKVLKWIILPSRPRASFRFDTSSKLEGNDPEDNQRPSARCEAGRGLPARSSPSPISVLRWSPSDPTDRGWQRYKTGWWSRAPGSA